MIRAGNQNTLTYMSSPNVYGLSDLSRYGTWVNVAGFGYSWRPFSVGFTWTPYFNGKFILDPVLGWIWVSSEPWGWMPYHFGSWLLAPNLGWVWVPGGSAGLKQWEPSRVNWVHVGNQVGWVAKSPNDREGAPANVAHGIVTRSGRIPGNGNENHEILPGKELRNIAPLKQPPPEFASRPAPGTQHAGIQSTIRLAPRPPDNNASIVYDSGTHTYINRDGSGENRSGIGNNPPVAPAILMPRSEAQTQVPRTTPQPPPSIQRVLLPPPYPVPPTRGNVPTNTLVPIRPPANTPFNAPLHPVAPVPLVPRIVSPPSVAPLPSRLRHAAPVAPHPEPGRSGFRGTSRNANSPDAACGKSLKTVAKSREIQRRRRSYVMMIPAYPTTPSRSPFTSPEVA